MNSIRWFTQRVTGFIVWPIVILAIQYVLTKIGQFFGLWESIDRLYPTSIIIFWILFGVTRVVFMLVWYKLGEIFINSGKKGGFFWFKSDDGYYSSRHESGPVDKSGLILAYVLVAVMATLIAELAIRLSTQTFPPYLPPPS